HGAWCSPTVVVPPVMTRSLCQEGHRTGIRTMMRSFCSRPQHGTQRGKVQIGHTALTWSTLHVWNLDYWRATCDRRTQAWCCGRSCARPPLRPRAGGLPPCTFRALSAWGCTSRGRLAFELGSPLCYCVTTLRRGELSPHTEKRYGSWHHRPVTRLHPQPGVH